MSQDNENPPTESAQSVPVAGADLFSQILAAAEADESTPNDPIFGDATGAPAAGAPVGAPENEGAPAGSPAGTPPEGGDGGGGDVPPEPTGYDPGILKETWSTARDKIETTAQERFRTEALATARESYGGYFDMLERHPRTMVGEQVASMTHPGQQETLRDEADVISWQEAVKKELVGEIQTNATQLYEASRSELDRRHSTVALFEQNPELLPNSKTFDKELATEFMSMVQSYATKNAGGKLDGFGIDVAPILAQVKKTVEARRAAAAAATPPAPTPRQEQAAAQPRTPVGQFAQQPQAGIPSSLGAGGEADDDYSALFSQTRLIL